MIPVPMYRLIFGFNETSAPQPSMTSQSFIVTLLHQGCTLSYGLSAGQDNVRSADSNTTQLTGNVPTSQGSSTHLQNWCNCAVPECTGPGPTVYLEIMCHCSRLTMVEETSSYLLLPERRT